MRKQYFHTKALNTKWAKLLGNPIAGWRHNFLHRQIPFLVASTNPTRKGEGFTGSKILTLMLLCM